MFNGNVEARLSALEVEMQEMRELLRETQQIVNSNAKAIQANSAANAELRQSLSETREIADSNARAIQAGSQATTELRDAVRLSFDDILNLNREVAIQQQQNTNDIRDLRAIVQDWLTQDRE